MRKNIDLPVEVVKILDHEAVDSKSKFKNLAESMLITIDTYSKYTETASIYEASDNAINMLKSVIQRKNS